MSTEPPNSISPTEKSYLTWQAQRIVEAYLKLDKSPIPRADTVVLLYAYYTRYGVCAQDAHQFNLRSEPEFRKRLNALCNVGLLRAEPVKEDKRKPVSFYHITDKGRELIHETIFK